MKAIDLNDRRSFYASDDLIEEMKAKNYCEPVINFAYTDYGGSFMDKVMIAYFKEKHPDSIVFEDTVYYGENALVFGPVAAEYLEATENYPLGFEDTEEYYFTEERGAEEEGFKTFLADIAEKYTVKDNALDTLLQERSGYYHITTQGIDYSERELIEWCLQHDIIEPISENV